MQSGPLPATSTLTFVPELALSDHSSDLASDGDDGDAEYDLGEADGWGAEPEPAEAGPSREGQGPESADIPRGKAAGLKAWVTEDWDDAALYNAFLAAKEEFLLFNDPIQPYAPFVVSEDLRARAKVKGKDSWKVRLELREAEARAAEEAAEGPVGGCVELSSLWYSRVGGRPKPQEAPQLESKRSKARAAKLRKAEQKAAAEAAVIDPYSSAAIAGNASRKRKLALDEEGVEPTSPEGYAPMSPTFSPTHTPLSPSMTGADLDFPLLDAMEDTEGVNTAAVEEEIAWEGVVVANNQLDPAQWDDAPLLSVWEEEEKAFAARHGTGKSWLTLATEAETLGIALEEHVAALEAARIAREGAAAGSDPSAAVQSGVEPRPKVDKVAERHLRRFAQASFDARGASASAATSAPVASDSELSYD